MKLYRYVDQHWGQNLSVSDEEITGVSGFPESMITRFLSFLGLIAGGTAIWTNPPTLGWLALTLFFFVMSLSYAYGRHTRIDRSNGQVTFSQSFFCIPVSSESAQLDHIRRQDHNGWIRNSTLILATTDGSDPVPLFQASSPGERETLNSHWNTVTAECPALVDSHGEEDAKQNDAG